MTTTRDHVDPIVIKVEQFIRRYVVLSAEQLRVCALWVLHTWQFSESVSPNPPITPYLYIHSGQPGSGKSTLGVRIFGLIARSAQPVANITPATLFALADTQATLLVDEVDTIYSGAKNDDLRGVLNIGYWKGASVPRREGKEVRNFNVYCAKVLIGIDNGRLPDTVLDRSIPIGMKRATTEESKTVEDFLMFEVVDEANALAEELHEWTVKHNDAGLYKPQKVEGIINRKWELYYPLLQVAHAAGCEHSAIKALNRVFSESGQDRETVEVTILRTIHALFERGKTDRIKVADLFAALNDSDDHRMSGIEGRGGGMWLAQRLRPFGIRVKTTAFGNERHKGLVRRDCEDAFSRYIYK